MKQHFTITTYLRLVTPALVVCWGMAGAVCGAAEGRRQF
jgi:hypothetical protein